MLSTQRLVLSFLFRLVKGLFKREMIGIYIRKYRERSFEIYENIGNDPLKGLIKAFSAFLRLL